MSGADPSVTSSPGDRTPDPTLVEDAAEDLAADRARIEDTTITDTMRAAAVIDLAADDATHDLRTDDSTFVLRAEDSTTVLETERQEEDDTVVTLTSDLLFDFGEATLTAEAEAAVADLAGDVPQDATVRVDGHTDAIGSDARNLTLSKKRAHAVADVLSDARPDLTLEVEGHGESDPVAANEVEGDDNPAGRALNRRVEVTYPTG